MADVEIDTHHRRMDALHECLEFGGVFHQKTRFRLHQDLDVEFFGLWKYFVQTPVEQLEGRFSVHTVQGSAGWDRYVPAA